MGKTPPCMSTEMKEWFDALAVDLSKRIDKVQEHLINVDAHLSNMEHEGSKENTDVAATTKAKLE
jgi:hypothetical protein